MKIQDTPTNLILNQLQDWVSQKDRYRLCQNLENMYSPALHTE